jgi:hypothetical protein
MFRRVIDYSQLSSWFNCPWYWYQRYIDGMSPRYVGQRDDSLALGSLTHNALDNWSKTGRPFIDTTTLLDVNPTPECKQIAESMAAGYIQRYPREKWEVEYTEEAVEFSLSPLSSWRGIAKLDGYFYVPEDTVVESGMPGVSLTLGRGWWSREYKTKSPAIPRGPWMMEWAAKRQADFQLLALQSQLGEPKDEYRGLSGPNGYNHEIRGVLVSVLEKPRIYTPKRKCKGCAESYPMEAYIVNAEGHACPMCGAIQHLKPYTPTSPPIADYFRMLVTRTPEQLEVARREITMVAEQMEDMVHAGMESIVPNRDNCISNRWHRKCDYAEQHIGGTVAAEPTFAKIDPYKYIGMPL